MRGSFRQTPEQLQALDRISAWTRERFALSADAPVSVTQLAYALPGCPPLETVVAFWTEGNRRHQFKLFKPMTEVLSADLPYAWQKNSLVAIDGEGCDCC
jgi:nitrate reductase delta subunit